MPKQIRQALKQVGWSKAAELAKAARRDQEQFKSATWVHKAREMSTQQFKEEVEKYLTGASEASELIYFKVYKSQAPVIEQALEIPPPFSLLANSLCSTWPPNPRIWPNFITIRDRTGLEKRPIRRSSGQIAGFSPESNLRVRFLKLNFVFSEALVRTLHPIFALRRE